MVPDVKFCGLVRPVDAAYAAELGAAYAGVIFAGGPRTLSPEHAQTVLREIPAGVRKVGVFGAQTPANIIEIAEQLELDVLQVHGHPSTMDVAKIRRSFSGELWLVSRAAGATLPTEIVEQFDIADAVVLDAFVAGRLGGTGVALPWNAVALELRAARRGRRLVLAGGLRPENVAEAIAALSPDVVDVSSGVELSPGVKDHALMRAFYDAVAATMVR